MDDFNVEGSWIHTLQNRIDDQRIEQLLFQAKNARESGLPLKVRKLRKGSIDAVSITYSAGILNSFTIIFASRSSDPFWSVIGYQDASTKHIPELSLLEIKEDNTISINMCIKDCLWTDAKYLEVDVYIDENIFEGYNQVVYLDPDLRGSEDWEAVVDE